MSKDPDRITVYVSDFEGAQAIPVFEGKYVQCICWSPDGKELLLRASELDDTTLPSVYLVPRLGGKVRRFDTPGSPQYFWDIAWLPDGTGFVSIANYRRLIYTDKKTGDTTDVPIGKEFWYTSIGNFSSDGNWLVLYGASETEHGLWVISSDGIRVHKLGMGLYTQSTWSPNGKAVYAIEESFAPRSFRLWRFNVNSQSGELVGEPEMLLSGLPSTLGISVSDDGEKLLCRQFDYTCNLRRVFFDSEIDPGSLRREQLTAGTGRISTPSISPDGKYISYSAESGGEIHVFARAIDGGKPVQITHFGLLNLASCWSPNGENIAVMGIGSLDEGECLYVATVSSDGTTSRMLTNLCGELSDPWLDWSIQDRLIADYVGRKGLLFVNPEVGDTTSWKYDSLKGRLKFPRLSPDGQMIAASRERPGLDLTDILVISMMDGTESLIAELDAYILGWSRDSRFVYFFTEERLIAKVDIISKKIDTLAILPDMDWFMRGTSIALSPDEKWAVYEVGQVQRDIYLIENFDPHVE